ncbi:hypothetical protein HMPREF9318_00526 [Streptococcus urinalis FB127-CNA-2]|uniref:Uncharacterized protein n=1 Tax=Streptococcus urinalis 2285-97 TaxID=764291 RepID=G5KGG1_9STRE|nr:hypothetical protein STRUR_1279 [Streptococcus urinalis 2285-97]EKS22328.1 hypothetical protein HMPREF9318_00526 [Streptococcus urinalis FB127-CNA-2]VEF32140.1 integral membrane protein [Streptococcus urinalis]
MNKIERTIKITIATLVAIVIASYLHLNNASSAGIIAILSVLETKQSTLKVALQRLLAFILAFSIASLLFSYFGYTLIVFGIFLLIYIPFAYQFNLETGVAPITVLVTHIYGIKQVSLDLIGNEFLLFFIGVSAALCCNTYMSSFEKEIQEKHIDVEQYLKQFFFILNLS